jgi:hypothetical protein
MGRHRENQDRKPSTSPQNIGKTVWYYEGEKSFEFVVECRDESGFHKTIQFKVPVKMLAASLARCLPTPNPGEK